MEMPELLLKLFVTIGADGQVRCRTNTQVYLDAQELEKKRLVVIQQAVRIDTVFICLSDEGLRLFAEIQRLLSGSHHDCEDAACYND